MASNLGNTPGSTVPLDKFECKTKNLSILQIYENRYKAGTNWSSAETKIEKKINNTSMGYIGFNSNNNIYGLSFGGNNIEILTLNPFGNPISPPNINPIVDIKGNLNVSKDIDFKGNLFQDGVQINLAEMSSVEINGKISPTSSTLIGKFGNNSYTGSGNFISFADDDLELGLFMTAAHCVITKNSSGQIEIADTIIITNPITKQYVNITDLSVKVVWDGIADVALIKTGMPLTPAYVLYLASEAPKTGDKCYSIGNPLGEDTHSFSGGYVRDNNWNDSDGYQVPPTLLTDISINGGNSGGAVVNAKGNIISLTTFGFNSADHINGGANFNTLKDILPKLKSLVTMSPDENFIDIYVSAGSFSTPFYNFYTDSAGNNEINSLNTNNNYRFHRLNGATSHPFYISDVGYKIPSTTISLNGNGSPGSGITGNQTFTLKFNGLSSSVPLYYFCTSHSSMFLTFNTINLLNRPQNNIYKWYLGIDCFRSNTFALELKNIYDKNQFPNEGFEINAINQTYSPFKNILKIGDIILSFKYEYDNSSFSESISLGLLPNQYGLGNLMYGPIPKIKIAYLERNDGYKQKETPTITLSNFENIPLSYDYFLSGNKSHKNPKNSIELI
jgi:S1-C subfamily serine protease